MVIRGYGMDGWTQIANGIVFFIVICFGMRFVWFMALGACLAKSGLALKLAFFLFLFMAIATLDKCSIIHEEPTTSIQEYEYQVGEQGNDGVAV